MSDSITLRGFVASDVRMIISEQGVPIASFLLGCTERRQDKATGLWADGDVNWYQVSTFRFLAQNTAFSIKKGEKVLVTGRLKLRHWTKNDGTMAASLDLAAESLGHDLNFGTAVYQRQNAQRREDEAMRLSGSAHHDAIPHTADSPAMERTMGERDGDQDEFEDEPDEAASAETTTDGGSGGADGEDTDESEEFDPMTGELLGAQAPF
ncbi:single-stranded DNA-binding protein [Arthrobacter sp. 35W]|uniref:single-stranded DNA-binding protein n=1 Tax=Arthrobacter sp. 35W TaxID=1132441 RepID=UPI00068705E4|nr:single-stranded DNA-binding protein [Arthrobacter sp. 35W]